MLALCWQFATGSLLNAGSGSGSEWRIFAAEECRITESKVALRAIFFPCFRWSKIFGSGKTFRMHGARDGFRGGGRAKPHGHSEGQRSGDGVTQGFAYGDGQHEGRFSDGLAVSNRPWL